MLSLTRKADYAVMAMAELAHRAPERVSARNLAEVLHVPLPVLTAVLHQLRQADLVASVMGGKGGYALARDPSEISLAEIIEAIEGPMRLALCCGDDRNAAPADAPTCDLESDCRIKIPLQRVHSSLRSFLERIRLRHLAFGDPPGPHESRSGFSGCGCGGASGAATVTVGIADTGSQEYGHCTDGSGGPGS